MPGLDVAANLFLGHELMRPGGTLDVASMGREARRRLEPIEPTIEPSRLIADLLIGQRKVVAIAKALSYATRVLIMDEPTAALTAAEVERLFGIMRRLKQTGVGIVYISHRLEEVPQIADMVTVMRDGRVAAFPCPTRRKPSSCGCWSAGVSRSCIRRGRRRSAACCCGCATPGSG